MSGFPAGLTTEAPRQHKGGRIHECRILGYRGLNIARTIDRPDVARTGIDTTADPHCVKAGHQTR